MELKHPTCTIAMKRTMREDMNCGLWLKPKREIKILNCMALLGHFLVGLVKAHIILIQMFL
nr:hypothetical protein BgiMline_034447 [Biomphalaria glabrata]